jgi:hypothetical protein
MKLSAPMRNALEAAARNPLRRTHDTTAGKPSWPAHPSTLAALVDEKHGRGYLVRTEERNRKGFRVDVWTLTDAGREALHPPPRFRPDKPLFMAHGAIHYRKLKSKGPKDLGRWAVVDSEQSSDYTTSRVKAIDELEVMETDRLASFTTAAREREQERRRQNGVALDARVFDERLEHARLTARERRMDVTGELWVIRQIAGMGREQSAVRRLVRLETQLQQRAA